MDSQDSCLFDPLEEAVVDYTDMRRGRYREKSHGL